MKKKKANSSKKVRGRQPSKNGKKSKVQKIRRYLDRRKKKKKR